MMARVILFLLCTLAVWGTPAAAQTGAGGLPARSDLDDDGWTTLRPGGETRCALGGEFEFHVRTRDPQRVLIFLYGGGACWDADGCAPESGLYVHTLQATSHPAFLGGIFDFANPANPFADYDVVAVPYCSGDVFLGDRDAVYRARGGEAREFTIHHRGQINTMAVLAWVQASYDAPARVVVAGSSAGGAGMPLYAHLLARHYPTAQVVGFGDDAGGYGVATQRVDLGVWGLPEVLRRHTGWEDYEAWLRIDALYATAGRGVANLRLHQIDHAWDATQRRFIERAGTPDPELPALIRASRAAIRRELPDFRAVTLAGFSHTIFVTSMFYRYRLGDMSLRDWVAAAASGEAVPDVECADCDRPVLMRDEADLAIIDRAIALLSEPGAWNSHDPGGGCPAAAPLSLRCAVARAIRDVSQRAPGAASHAGSLEVLLEAAERMQWRHANAIISFNNRPGATVEDVLELLQSVRRRVAGAPQLRP
jgi:hypothetical protein